MDIMLENVEKKFGSAYGVKALDLQINQGEMVALLGPSGCGKTTTLFMLAGVYRPTNGTIRFGERVVNNLRPQERKIGMVFQSYALYPHMSVFDNIAFPLTVKKLSRNEIKPKVQMAAEMVQIEHLLKRKPSELSGGQQQRVSLARALVKEPEILLLDEPLSNLDAALRMQMRVQILRIQRELGITAVFVTHDQTEAMTMADKIALMKDGSLIAYGKPMELYGRPERQFVAEFLGSPPINIIPLQVKNRNLIDRHGKTIFALPEAESVSEGKVSLGIRPEHITLVQAEEGNIVARLVLIEALGHEYIYSLNYHDQIIHVRTFDSVPVKEGTDVGLCINWQKSHWFDPDGKRLDMKMELIR